jgi:dolichol-phosphate mannosyltransferase
MESVSLIIPAWHEAARLGPTLSRYVPSIRDSGREFEIIVIADCPGDGTVEAARGFDDPSIRIREFPFRLGKGGAILAGFDMARNDIVGFVDADGPVPASDLLKLIRLVESQDVCAIGSRAVYGSHVSGSVSRARRVFSRGWTFIVRLATGIRVGDFQCGAKFVHRHRLDSVLREVNATNWAFDVSLLFHLTRRGTEIRELPVTWSERGGSHLPLPKAMPAMLFTLLGIRFIDGKSLGGIARKFIGWAQNLAPVGGL